MKIRGPKVFSRGCALSLPMVRRELYVASRPMKDSMLKLVAGGYLPCLLW